MLPAVGQHLQRFLASPLGLRDSAQRRLNKVRDAMLSMLNGHGGLSMQRVSQRVRFADDLEALWYLRQDVLLALSTVHGELSARRQLREINRLFKGWLPGALAPRRHHSFVT